MIKATSSQSVFYRICVEGNIGCGKTSVLKHIAAQHGYTGDYEQDIWKPKIPDQSSLNLIVSPEPLTRWTSVGPAHVNLLNQICAPSSMSTLTRTSVADGRRSICWSGPYSPIGSALWRTFIRAGKIHKAEYAILDEWFKYLMTRPECQINKFIYLRTSPQTVYDRIQKRARSEDELIPLSYLADVHKYHERLFDTIDMNCWKHLKRPMAKVVIIDADQSMEDVRRQIDKHISSTVI
ncbi:Deoxynucleoside kinase [Tyrophagus putrescentiae]|nr:Deoxynucleoside kinase [Tyrophagus putrescentiae]